MGSNAAEIYIFMIGNVHYMIFLMISSLIDCSESFYLYEIVCVVITDV